MLQAAAGLLAAMSRRVMFFRRRRVRTHCTRSEQHGEGERGNPTFEQATAQSTTNLHPSTRRLRGALL